MNPLEGAVKFGAPPVCVKQSEDVDAYDRVKSGSFWVKICLKVVRLISPLERDPRPETGGY